MSVSSQTQPTPDLSDADASAPCSATVDQLEAAKAELARWRDRMSRTRPGELADTYQFAARNAEQYVASLTADLLRQGLLPALDSTRLHEGLQRTHPHARNRQVVTFQGARFRKRISRKAVPGAEPQYRVWWEAV